MAVWTMSLAVAAAEAEGAALGDVAVVGAGLGVDAAVGAALGDAAAEQAAIAIASAGTRMAMGRFMTCCSLQALHWMSCQVYLTDALFSTKSFLSTRDCTTPTSSLVWERQVALAELRGGWKVARLVPRPGNGSPTLRCALGSGWCHAGRTANQVTNPPHRVT